MNIGIKKQGVVYATPREHKDGWVTKLTLALVCLVWLLLAVLALVGVVLHWAVRLPWTLLRACRPGKVEWT